MSTPNPNYEPYDNNTDRRSSSNLAHWLTTILTSAAVAALVSFGAPYFMGKNENDGDFDQRVAQSLQRNPDAVYGSLVEFQHREEEKQKQAALKAVQDNKEKIFNDPASPVIGNPNGDVTIVEFFDYNCGHCRKISADVDRLVKEDGNIKVVHKQFPILPPETSREAAVIALAVKGNPENYAAFHQTLMEQKVLLTDALVRAAALQTAGLNSDQATAALGQPEFKQQIDDNYKLAQALNIQGTPAFVIGDEVVYGERNYDELKKMVADLRNKTKPSSQQPSTRTTETPTAEMAPTPDETAAPAGEADTPAATTAPAAPAGNAPTPLTPPETVKPSPNQD